MASMSGCDKGKESSKAAETQKPAEVSGWGEWFAKNTDTDWLKSQWSKGSELAKTAKTSLDSIKVDELKQQVSELTKALETQDFGKIEGMADQIGKIGKLLTVDKLVEGMRFVAIQRQKGGEAAVKAVEEYAARNDLNEFEKTAAENLKNGMALIQRDDVQGYVCLAIFYACECKLGAHQGGLLAIPIISILFPDYLEKHGTKL